MRNELTVKVVKYWTPHLFSQSLRTDNFSLNLIAGVKTLATFRENYLFGKHALRASGKYIYSMLINGMCLFEAGAATAATVASVELDVQYKRLRRPLATAWRTKRSGIISERYLSMRAPSVAPRYALAVGSILRGNGDGGNT